MEPIGKIDNCVGTFDGKLKYINEESIHHIMQLYI